MRCKECETMLSVKNINKEMYYYCTQCGTNEKSTDTLVYSQDYDTLLKYVSSNQLKILDMTIHYLGQIYMSKSSM